MIVVSCNRMFNFVTALLAMMVALPITHVTTKNDNYKKFYP